MDQKSIEQIITQVLIEKLGPYLKNKERKEQLFSCKKNMFRDEADGVIQVEIPKLSVRPEDWLDTGCRKDKVYTRDLFSLEESPRLGCGIMEMEQTTFDWKLDYDEIDYVVDGFLTIIKNGKCVTAGPGEVIFIPKGSAIQFSVPDKARFLYVTYPADWAG